MLQFVFDRGELGLKFLGEVASELSGQRARAFASERTLHRFALERLGPGSRLGELGPKRLERRGRGLARDAHLFGRGVQLRLARTRGLGLCG